MKGLGFRLALLVPFLAVAGVSAQDFDNDGVLDETLFRSATAQYFIHLSSLSEPYQFDLGTKGGYPVTGDFDEDGKTDLGSFDPTTGKWSILLNSDGSRHTVTSNAIGEFPAPGRYEGGPCAQLATYNPNTFEWTVPGCESSTAVKKFKFGKRDKFAIPVPGNYDGDNKDDWALFTRSLNRWEIYQSTTDRVLTVYFGQHGDIPVPGKYGDSTTKVAVWRPSTGQLLVRGADGKEQAAKSFGLSGDMPAAVLDGNVDKLSVYRPSAMEYFISNGSTAVQSQKSFSFLPELVATSGTNPVQLNAAVPLNLAAKLMDRGPTTDVDGDGADDIIFSGGVGSGTEYYIVKADGKTQIQSLNAAGFPVVADYDGDGAAEIATVVNSNGLLYWEILDQAGNSQEIQFGLNGDQAFSAHMDSDGKSDLIVIRKVTPYLQWYIRLATGKVVGPLLFGLSDTGDAPILSDIDGDGAAEIGIRRNLLGGIYWYWAEMSDLVRGKGNNPSAIQWGLAPPFKDFGFYADVNGDGRPDPVIARDYLGGITFYNRLSSTFNTTVAWGLTGDIPVVGRYFGNPWVDFAAIRPSTGEIYIRGAKGGTKTVKIPYGANKVILPDGSVYPLGDVSGASGACDVTTDFPDGARKGYLWKPDRDGGAAGPGGTIGIPADDYYQLADILLLGRDGKEVADVTNRYCCANGDRGWWDPRKSGESMAPYAPITVMFKYKSGKRVCKIVPDPRNRYD